MSTLLRVSFLAGLAGGLACSVALAAGDAVRPTSGARGGPPPLALEACDGARAGEACTLRGLYGERIRGVCTPTNGALACLSDDVTADGRRDGAN